MPSSPVTGARPQIKLIIDGRDWGHLFTRFEYKATVNAGYAVRAVMYDKGFVLLTKLTEDGYFRRGRSSEPFKLTFQILADPNGQHPQAATREQTVHVVGLRTWGDSANRATIEFICVDPATWYLSAGDGAGRAYRGRVSQVIRQVVAEYAPALELDIGESTDSDQNRWHMMRLDPKSFIASLTSWSSPLTQRRTRWMVTMDDTTLRVKEQAQIPSTQRAYYRFGGRGRGAVMGWKLLADNALHLVESQLVTQGMSAVSGTYYDRKSDQEKRIVYVNDATTPNKKVAMVGPDESFAKPGTGGPPGNGWTSMPSVPEIASGGEVGRSYRDYLDGIARDAYLAMVDQTMRLRLKTIGHGEWSTGLGLGTDTIYLRWFASQNSLGVDDRWYLSGNWLVHGFKHVVSRAAWVTYLDVSRADHDAVGERVGGGQQ